MEAKIYEHCIFGKHIRLAFDVRLHSSFLITFILMCENFSLLLHNMLLYITLTLRMIIQNLCGFISSNQILRSLRISRIKIPWYRSKLERMWNIYAQNTTGVQFNGVSIVLQKIASYSPSHHIEYSKAWLVWKTQLTFMKNSQNMLSFANLASKLYIIISMYDFTIVIPHDKFSRLQATLQILNQ